MNTGVKFSNFCTLELDERLCGFKTSVGFTKSLVNAINAAASKEVLSKLPAELPVLVLWGTRDPVTVNDFGTQSADQMEKQMKAAGKQLTKRIAYSGARHEVLLAPRHKTIGPVDFNLLVTVCRPINI